MSEEVRSSIRRVLIALDTAQQDIQTLDLAARFAAQRDLELVALFIEDQDLLQLAELPFASEINHRSGEERKLDSTRMAQLLRSEADKLSHRLERMTRELRLRYSLKVTRGRYIMEAVAASVETDVLFLHRYVGRYRRTYRERRRAGIAGTVWILYKGSPASDQALAVAAEIAASSNRQLVVLQQETAGEEATLRDRLQALARERRLNYTLMPCADLHHLVDVVHGNPGGLLVLHAADLEDRDQLTSGFLEELGCPVAVTF